MKVYFYHTQDTRRIVRECGEGKFPAHFLYGATELGKHGIDVIWHDQVHTYRRVRDTLRATWRILTCREPYDVLYATHTRGIEPIVLLHRLGLYRHPIVVWHHQPIVRARNPLREALARQFYRGLDHMIFFSDKLVSDSLRSAKADAGRMSVVPWGADLAFYDSLRPDGKNPSDFISTGKEMRDYWTLVRAFNNSGADLTLFVRETDREYFSHLHIEPNICMMYGNRLMPREIALLVAQSRCVCVCCRESDYTVGLTTVVEAMALGLPVVCTLNPQMPMEPGRDGFGYCVEPGDTLGWELAIHCITADPENARAMGRKGRKLAEEMYNNERCGREVAAILWKVFKK